MSVRVLFFASLKDALGRDEITLELTEPVPLEDLLGLLRPCLPAAGFAALTADNVRVAVNQTLAASVVQIAPGDEIAFLPPVTGG